MTDITVTFSWFFYFNIQSYRKRTLKWNEHSFGVLTQQVASPPRDDRFHFAYNTRLSFKTLAPFPYPTALFTCNTCSAFGHALWELSEGILGSKGNFFVCFSRFSTNQLAGTWNILDTGTVVDYSRHHVSVYFCQSYIVVVWYCGAKPINK